MFRLLIEQKIWIYLNKPYVLSFSLGNLLICRSLNVEFLILRNICYDFLLNLQNRENKFLIGPKNKTLPNKSIVFSVLSKRKKKS
jgi:hypothetical protein